MRHAIKFLLLEQGRLAEAAEEIRSHKKFEEIPSRIPQEAAQLNLRQMRTFLRVFF